MDKRLILGDILAILIITILGFVTHGEANVSFLSRFAALSIPLSISWLLLAPWFGLFQEEVASNPQQLWRPVFAMVFAVPFAAVLRSLVLNTAILPIFVVVLMATLAFGILLWRGLYFLIARKA